MWKCNLYFSIFLLVILEYTCFIDQKIKDLITNNEERRLMPKYVKDKVIVSIWTMRLWRTHSLF